jgi:hypothetical protein
MVIWTLPGTVLTDVVIVEVNAVVRVDTVDTMVVVSVAVSTPPKGANWSMVESEGEGGVGTPKKGDAPTIQPALGFIMYTEFNVGGAQQPKGLLPNSEGARVTNDHATPSQWKIVARSDPATGGLPVGGMTPPTVQQSVGPVQYIEFKVGGEPTGPKGMLGVETVVQCVPSQ